MRKGATGKLDQLFKPFSLGTMNLKNRIVMTALATSFMDEDQVIFGTFGETRSIPCDHVVLAEGASPVREVVTSIRDKFPNLFLIGDCVEPRSAKEAIYEGSRIAREI